MSVITVRGPFGPPVSYRFDKPVITVGRAPENDVALDDPAASRVHVEIRHDRGRWTVEDRGSRNGTLLNGKDLQRSAVVSPGDEIAVGDTVIVLSEASGGSGALGTDRPTEPLTWSARAVGPDGDDLALIGRSAAIRALVATIDRIASNSATVVISGESGTGKNLVARLIHHRSPRSAGPFVVVSCPTLPGNLLEAELFGIEKGVATGVDARPGRLEVAAGGTLLLDEIGDMSAAAQADLLRFLEEKTIERVGGRKALVIDARVLAATHHDLAADVKAGAFRRDLYHRLNTLHVVLPPLRERREDIPLLIDHLLGRHRAPRRTFAASTMDLLLAHDFPGNVRELDRIIEPVVLLGAGPVVSIDDLPEDIRPSRPSPAADTTHVDREAALLLRRVVDGKESFWEVVHRPFLDRTLSRLVVERLVAQAHREAGGSYRRMAQLFGIDADHRRLLNFLYRNGLRVRKGAKAG